ncbi:hypothetical protein VKT23_002569 [Stygiomarasmius scandens]|uniref:F-box domain-containing protein n=1 Tax=Marasmiellus scandens TaxID=2682957 RepID=A0ABR1K2T8_9AGAR
MKKIARTKSLPTPSQSSRRSERLFARAQPKFPLDLVLTVLDELRIDGDRRTIRACALVCRLWRQPSQRLLFSSLYIRDSYSSEDRFEISCQKWAKRFEESTHIAPFFTELFILPKPGKLENTPLFKDLAPKLTNVRSLILRGNAFGTSVNELALCLNQHAQIQNLTLIEPRKWRNVLIGMLELTSLSIIDPLDSFSDMEPYTCDPSVPALGALRYLSLSGAERNSSLLEFLASFHYPRLCSLEIQPGRYSHIPTCPVFGEFLQTLRTGKLENLRIFLPFSFLYGERVRASCIADMIEKKLLSNFRYLRHFSVVIPKVWSASLSIAWNLIITLRAPGLRQVSIVIEDFGGDLGDCLEWRSLDDWFSDEQRYPHLSRLEVTLTNLMVLNTHPRKLAKNHSVIDESQFRVMVPIVTSRMPKLSNKDVLHFVVATQAGTAAVITKYGVSKNADSMLNSRFLGML